MSQVFACVMEQQRYFNVEADDEEQMQEWLNTHTMQDIDNLTKDYTDEYYERIYDESNTAVRYVPHFSIATKYYPVYSEEHDMTFIMKETENNITVCGFYFGPPNEDLTKNYANNLSTDKTILAEKHVKGMI